MIEAIRRFLIKRKLKSNFNPNPYPGFDQVKTISFLWGDGKYDDTVLRYKKQLEEAGKEVVLLRLMAEKPEKEKQFPYPHIYRKEINMFGMSRSVVLHEFTKRHHEVLIDLCERKANSLDWVRVATTADLKVGIMQGEWLTLDVVIEKENEPEKIMEEMFRYLKWINK